MKHVDLFASFFADVGRGTANEIHAYLINNKAEFNCKSGKESDEIKSVNRQISKEIGKLYPTGHVTRMKNYRGVFEYYTI